MKRFIIIGLPVILLLATLIILGSLYWHHKKLFPSTDNAYVNAKVIHIASEISGPVIEVNPRIHDHAHVYKGEPLFNIDPRPFQIAHTKAETDLALARQQMQIDDKTVEAAEAKVSQAAAELHNTHAQTQRVLTLTQQKILPLSQRDDAIARLKIAKATLIASKTTLAKAIAIRGALNDQNEHLKAATAMLAKRSLDLQHTHVVAPASGDLANFHLRVGDMVTSYQPLFALIEDHSQWIDANFKEAELTHIQPNERATITLDMYPGIHFKGQVQSISPSSGTSFSLFPPENATGNWVKVTQRFPVKIRIVSEETRYPLRLGASSRVVIDTTHHNETLPPS